MVTGVFVTLAILGAIAAVVVLVAQRGRDTLDLSLRGLLRAYLYLASLAGVIVLTIGAAGILSFVLAATFGLDLVYGGPPPQPAPFVAPCPPGQPNCTPAPVPVKTIPDERQRRQQDDLVRGLTFGVFGLVFWGAHRMARGGMVAPDEGSTGLYRSYLMLGTAIFAVATIVLLPAGIYQALSNALVATQPNTFRQGAGDSLSGGLVALLVWLAYLWLVMRTIRARSTVA